MIVNITARDNDDREFIAALSSMVAVLVKKDNPVDLHLIRINKWFDHKWLLYSGKGRVAFDGYPFRDTALDEFHQDYVTLPPFNPKQIGEQQYWRRGHDGGYLVTESEKPLHKKQLRSSSENLNQRISDLSSSAIYVWFTSDTLKNTHGSVMVYTVDGTSVDGWYASFRSFKSWRVDKVKGISKAALDKWFPQQ